MPRPHAGGRRGVYDGFRPPEVRTPLIQPDNKTLEPPAKPSDGPRAGGRVRFADAREAGRALASRLASFAATEDEVVVGLASGGVPVAFEVARALGATL